MDISSKTPIAWLNRQRPTNRLGTAVPIDQAGIIEKIRKNPCCKKAPPSQPNKPYLTMDILNLLDGRKG